MVDYCTERDVYEHGAPRGSVPNEARLIPEGKIDPATNTISIDGHGFLLGDEVVFRAEAGGTMPAPLVALTTYYARPVDAFRFEVAAAPGGPAIDLTTAGSRVLVFSEPPISAAISWASGVVEENIPAHVVPLVAPFPRTVVHVTAELAAGKFALRGGATSEALGKIVEAAQKRLASWAKHIPIRGDNAPPQASLSAAVAAQSSNPWRRHGGL